MPRTPDLVDIFTARQEGRDIADPFVMDDYSEESYA